MAEGLTRVIGVWHQLARLSRVDVARLLPPLAVTNAALGEAYTLLCEATPPARAAMVARLREAIDVVASLGRRLAELDPPKDN